jgi:hypothetical protein
MSSSSGQEWSNQPPSQQQETHLASPQQPIDQQVSQHQPSPVAMVAPNLLDLEDDKSK